MVTTTAPIHTLIGRCHTCDKHLSVRWTIEQAQDANWYARCPGCNRRRNVRLIDTKTGKRECGEWCTTGTGKSCTCTCGGANHGLAWRVK